MVITEKQENLTRLRLESNCSASWEQTRLMIICTGGFSLLIAFLWTLRGAWGVLPFAGLEVSLLAFIAYRACWKSHHKHIISINPQTVRVEWGMDSCKKSWEFDRNCTRITVERARHSLSADTVHIRDDNQSLFISRQLNLQDTDELVRQLYKTGLACQFTGRTLITAIENFDT